MKLTRILFEMSVQNALEILNLDNKDIGNTDVIKSAYRKASLIAHPDRGGSDAAFRSVKDAYDLLSKQTSNVVNRQSWADIKEKYKAAGESVLSKLKTEFDITLYKEHLEKIFNQLFNHKIKKESITDSFALYSHEFFNESRDIVFDIDMSVYLVNVVHNRGGLVSGNQNISYPLGVSTSILYNGKKAKIAQRSYQQTQNHDVLSDPELVLPVKKLKSFDVATAKKKFSKSDMFQILSKKYNLSINGNDVYKQYKLDKRVHIQFSRSTFMKMPFWSIYVFLDSKSQRIPHKSFEETQETAELFGKIIKMSDSVKTSDEIIELITRELNKNK